MQRAGSRRLHCRSMGLVRSLGGSSSLLRMTRLIGQILSYLAIWLIAVALIPSIAQVAPFPIRRFDQSDLLISPIGFQLFFSADRCHNALVSFEVNERSDIVFGCESAESVGLVLEDTLFDVTCHSYVEDASLAREDIDVVGLLLG